MLKLPKHIIELDEFKRTPGSEVFAGKALERTALLHLNYNNLGVSPKVRQNIIDFVSGNKVPSKTRRAQFKGLIADYHNAAFNDVFIGAGAEIVLSTIAQALLEKGGRVVIPSGTPKKLTSVFLKQGLSIDEVEIKKDGNVDLSEVLLAANNGASAVFICNPHNPTGGIITKGQLRAFLDKLPSSVVCIFDETYSEYVPKESRFADSFLTRKPNVITVKSMSKLYALGGFSLAYALGNEQVMAYLKRVTLRDTLSEIAMVTGIGALEDQAHMERTIMINQGVLSAIANTLAKHEILFYPSLANFITLRLNKVKHAKSLHEDLINRGVLVAMLEGDEWSKCLRISTGTPEETDFLIAHLDQLLPALGKD